jgi:FAD/FMN-containing dehydrogenase
MNWGGSLAAEHGIGQAKLHDQQRYKDPIEYALMQTMKKTLDPQTLFNPDKVISLKP